MSRREPANAGGVAMAANDSDDLRVETRDGVALLKMKPPGALERALAADDRRRDRGARVPRTLTRASYSASPDWSPGSARLGPSQPGARSRPRRATWCRREPHARPGRRFPPRSPRAPNMRVRLSGDARCARPAMSMTARAVFIDLGRLVADRLNGFPKPLRVTPKFFDQSRNS